MRACRALCFCALPLASACVGEPPAEDLLDTLPHAEVRRADGDLLFSERVERRGWGLVEQDQEGAFRWAVGGESEVEFHALASGATKLAARARGAIAPGLTTQPLRVLLNDVEIAALELGRDWGDLELPLAPPVLRRGTNRLSLRFAKPLTPGVTDREARPLTACFRTLRVGPRTGAADAAAPWRLDLGSTAAAGLLRDGWSEPIAGAAGAAGSRWALAPAAILELDLPTPADRRILIEARRPAALVSQRLEVWLNGRQLSADDLAAEWVTLAVEAPREEWLAGGNRLVLRCDSHVTAADGQRAAEVARLAIETVAEPALEVGRDSAGRRVLQPAGTSVDLFHRLPERAPRLLLAARGHGGAAARVVLDVQADGGEASEAWRGELTAGRSESLDLSAWAGALVRLRLSAVGVGLVWRRLELRGRWKQDTAATVAPQAKARGAARVTRPNLLLYVIDTLRADHTSLYGYHRRTTPRLEALAGDSIVFDPAYANASWTRPGTASLLTGALPSAHGATSTLSRLSPDVELLSEALQAAGYATYAMVTNPYLGGRWGLERGWDEYRYIDLALDFSESSAVLNRDVIPRLGKLAAADRPFFLYLHSMDPHPAYDPPAGYRQFLDAGYRGWVDGSMESVDRLLGVAHRDGAEAHAADLAQLAGLYDGRQRQEQVRIPMLLRPPGGVAPRRVAGAQQVDVAVMLAALAGVAPPRAAIGRDLPSVGDAAGRAVFAETELGDRRLWSYIDGGMKLHYNRNSRHAEWRRQETHELFDLAADADEKSNLYTTRPVVAGYLLQRARQLVARLPSAEEREMISAEELSEELREQLRALGYLE